MADDLVVAMSGLPASGKSTLARRLGPLLGIPVVDRDDLLEAPFTGAEPCPRLLAG